MFSIAPFARPRCGKTHVLTNATESFQYVFEVVLEQVGRYAGQGSSRAKVREQHSGQNFVSTGTPKIRAASPNRKNAAPAPGAHHASVAMPVSTVAISGASGR